MRINNWKQFLTILIINVIVGLILTLNCEGEKCMIIIFAFFYVLAVIISHLPYLFLKPFKQINNDKLLAFIFPSLLMFLIIVLSIKIGSNIPLNSHNLLSIIAVILPNTVLQLIFFFNRNRIKSNNVPSK